MSHFRWFALVMDFGVALALHLGLVLVIGLAFVFFINFGFIVAVFIDVGLGHALVLDRASRLVLGVVTFCVSSFL